MPPADIRQLRDLMRYRFKLTCFQSSEKNRLQNCLTVSNIQLGSVVSDTFGKSSQRILDRILENPLDVSFDIAPLIHGSMKEKLPELELAVDGYITPEQAGKLKIIKAHFEDLETRKAELEELILALAMPYALTSIRIFSHMQQCIPQVLVMFPFPGVLSPLPDILLVPGQNLAGIKRLQYVFIFGQFPASLPLGWVR